MANFKTNQIFQSILVATLVFVIYSKECGKITAVTPTEIIRERLISEARHKIMSRIFLNRYPNVQRNVHDSRISPNMKNLLKNEVALEERAGNVVNNQRTITATLNLDISCRRNQKVNRECFAAKIPNMDTEIIESVKLIASLKSDIQTAFDNIVTYNLSLNNLHFENYVKVDSQRSDNVEIDLLNMFKKFIFPDRVSNEKVVAMFFSLDGPVSSLPIREVIDVNHMVLEIKYKESKLLRSKRDANMCDPNNYFCCTQNMTLTIEELGLTPYILAPKTFNINYCKGDCNNYIQNASNNSKARNLFKSRNSSETKEARSCCVPFSFSSVPIMYEDTDATIKMSTFDDLIVATCGCL